jgi:hypothetical protein
MNGNPESKSALHLVYKNAGLGIGAAHFWQIDGHDILLKIV